MNSENAFRALVVEDNDAVRLSVEASLQDMGLEVHALPDGSQVQALLKEIRFDLVILDLRLPDIDGLDILSQVKSTFPETAVIVVTGNATLDDSIVALRLGAFDFVQKPFRSMEFLGFVVKRALEHVRLTRESRQRHEYLEGEIESRTLQLRDANAQLEVKNSALREVLSSIEEERKLVGQEIVRNVEHVILPSLRSLKSLVSGSGKRILEHIEQSLQEITSPFVDKLSKSMNGLTPTELRICHFVAKGLAVKEVAEIEHLSPETVAAHRRNIRRKLGISHAKVNLATHLKYLLEQA